MIELSWRIPWSSSLYFTNLAIEGAVHQKIRKIFVDAIDINYFLDFLFKCNYCLHDKNNNHKKIPTFSICNS